MRSPRRSLAAGLFAFVGLACAAAPALAVDTVLLKSGGMMEGRIQSIDDFNVVLAFQGGSSTFQRTQVVGIFLDRSAEQVQASVNITALATGTTTPSAPTSPTAPTGPTTPTSPTPPTAPGPLYPVNPNGPVSPSTPVAPIALPDSVGEWKQAGDLRVRLLAPRVGRVQLRDFFGNVVESRETFLILEMDIQNANPSQSMAFRVPPFGQPFTLRDETGRGVEQEFAGGEVVGALRSPATIGAGMSTRHIELFKKPSRNPARFTLDLDTAVFGQSQDLSFTILQSSIQR